MQFSLFNAEERSVSVTLTEEIPSGVHVLDVGEGAYNDVARYIVWRVDLAAGEEVIVGYEAQIQDAGVGLPFFAYGTTTGGEAAEDAFALHPGVVPISLHLGDTMTAVGEPTDLTVD